MMRLKYSKRKKRLQMMFQIKRVDVEAPDEKEEMAADEMPNK